MPAQNPIEVVDAWAKWSGVSCAEQHSKSRFAFLWRKENMLRHFELRQIVVFAVLLAGSMAFAQTAEITGRVIDTSGGVVPGAGVTVLSLASGMDRNIPTNSEGYYTVPLLLPGEYRITVQHAGFKPIVRSGVVLAVDQRAELNFTLEVGSAMEK